jgi:hypothetical protein
MNPKIFRKFSGFSHEDENDANGIKKVFAGRDILAIINLHSLGEHDPQLPCPFYSHE